MTKKIIAAIKSIPSFLRETRSELKKVDWPTREQAIKYTLIVISASLIVALFLGGLDYLFSFLINKFVI